MYEAPQTRPQPPSNRLVRWLAFVLLVVAGALLYNVIRQRQDRPSSVQPPVLVPPPIITPRGDLAADEQATIALFSANSPAVVHITSIATRRSRFSLNVFDIPQGTGTGFVWDAAGHIVTNFHVISNASKAEVTFYDRTVVPAKIIGTAPHKDIAVLKILPPKNLKAVTLSTSGDLLVGQKVFAIGNPFGLDQTLTTGVISGLDREIQSMTGRPISDVIQTDAAINPGNSGGPLLDSAGRVIGVNTAIQSPTGAYAGIGFAVPIDTVTDIVPQLISNGKVMRPGMGIYLVPDAYALRLGIQGVIIREVPANTAAARAGLVGLRSNARGDILLGDVIVAINKTPIKSSQDIYRVLNHHKVGDTIDLEVSREKNRRTVQLVLQALN